MGIIINNLVTNNLVMHANPIYLVGSSVASNNSGSGNITVTQSTAIRAGDLLVTVGSGNASGGNQLWSASTGASGTTWTEAADQGTAPNLYVAYKTAVAADAGFVQTYNWVLSQSVAVHTLIFRYAQWDAIGSIATGTGTGSLTVPAVTTTADNAHIILFFAGTDMTLQSVPVPPFNTVSGPTTTGGTPVGSNTVLTRLQATAGSSGTATVTPLNGTGARAAVQLAVKPAI